MILVAKKTAHLGTKPDREPVRQLQANILQKLGADSRNDLLRRLFG